MDAQSLPAKTRTARKGVHIPERVENAQSNGHSNGHVSGEGLGPFTPVADGSAPKKYPHTEVGNTERFLDQYRGDMLFCPAHGWLVYKGGKWHRDREHVVRSRIVRSIRSIQAEVGRVLIKASKCPDTEDGNTRRKELEQEARSLMKWGRASETAHMVRSILTLAQPELLVSADLFDADPWLLNVKNGTLDLRSGELRPHSKDDYLMKQCRVSYDPAATAPITMEWLDQIFCGDAELIAYVQQVLGYSLTGNTMEQKWFLLLGGGQNGKSTLMRLLHHILADYAAEVSPDTFTASSFARSGSEATPDLVRLAGARVVVASETDAGARLKPALLKRLTGGDAIVARDLRCSPLEFVPQFKLFLDTNHPPQVRERSHAFWRRVRLIPFNYRIPDAARDGTIEDRMHAEASGVLTWMIEGLRAYLAAGRHLPHSQAVEDATEQYRAEQDILSTFLGEQCVLDKRAEQPAQKLYDEFRTWTEEQMGERAMAYRSFAQALSDLGYISRRNKKGVVWSGFRLRAARDPLPGSEKMEDAHE